MLTGDSLNEDLFATATWWANTELVNDFWTELPHKLVRVHITPRRRFFDPRKWETSQTHLRELLLLQLGSVRETWGIGCMSRRMLSTVIEQWLDKDLGEYPTLWIGRSVFNRSQAAPLTRPIGHAPSMEDDEGAADRRVPPTRPGFQRLMGLPRAPVDHPGGQGLRDEDKGAAVPKELGGAEGRGPQDGVGSEHRGHEGEPHAAHPGRGRFRGTTFEQIPDNYGDWASEEQRQNTNMHNDLKRFVMRRRHRRNTGKTSTSAALGHSTPSYLDAETYATVPPPPLSETGSSSWAMVPDYESAFQEGYNTVGRGPPAQWMECQTPVGARHANRDPRQT